MKHVLQPMEEKTPTQTGSQYEKPAVTTYSEEFLKEQFAEVFAFRVFSDTWAAGPDN